MKRIAECIFMLLLGASAAFGQATESGSTAITGSATVAPAGLVAVLSPLSLSFAIQSINTTSSAQSVTLTAGNAAMTISSIALQTGTQFAISSNTCGSSLTANSSCTVGVTFTPTSAGAQSDNLKFTDSAPGSPQSVSLSGTGVPSVIQTCMTNCWGTSCACATSSGVPAQNFTAGLCIIQLGTVDNTDITAAPTCSGAGCPSSWTNVDTYTSSSATATANLGISQAGAATITVAQTGSAAELTSYWWAISGATCTADGVGAYLRQWTGAGTTSGASYTTSHNFDFVAGGTWEQTSDSSFAVQSPFSVSSPCQSSLDSGTYGYPQAAACYSQSSAGSVTIEWTQGVGVWSESFVLGVY